MSDITPPTGIPEQTNNGPRPEDGPQPEDNEAPDLVEDDE